MKHLVTITATVLCLIIAATCLFSCGKDKEQKSNTNNEVTIAADAVDKVGAGKLKAYLGITGDDIVFETSDIERLKKENGTVFEKYSVVISFLESNFEQMSEQMTSEKDKNIYIENGFSSIVIDDFYFIDYADDSTNSDRLALYFNVSESSCEMLPKGKYYYKIDPLTWVNLESYKPDNEYADAISIVGSMAGNGAFSWKDGKGENDNFSFAVFRTLALFLQEKGIELSDEKLKSNAKAMFGIDNYSPELFIDSEKVDYFELKDGVWREKMDEVYIGAVLATYSVTDVRQTDNNSLELDVQYYADAYRLVPSHKVTVFVSLQNIADCEYFFREARITRKSEYEPYRVGV